MRFYPEIRAGGYSRIDTTVQFYLRIRSLINERAIVLDLGAGRGAGIEAASPGFRRNLVILRGACQKIIGVDVDAAVHENLYLDEAHVVKVGERLPFENETFDLIYSDWTFEHVADPVRFLAEVRRILKPGGWLCARTPNALSYQGIMTQLVPNRFHASILRWLQPGRVKRDVFETHMKMNTIFTLRRLFSSDRWCFIAYTWNGEPAYVGNSVLLWRLTTFLNWISPPSCGTIINVFAQKI